jgi:hypothetical protein
LGKACTLVLPAVQHSLDVLDQGLHGLDLAVAMALDYLADGDDLLAQGLGVVRGSLLVSISIMSGIGASRLKFSTPSMSRWG